MLLDTHSQNINNTHYSRQLIISRKQKKRSSFWETFMSVCWSIAQKTFFQLGPDHQHLKKQEEF